MRIAVIGAGLMGPTIVLDSLRSKEISEVLLIDVDVERLSAHEDLKGVKGVVYI